MAGDLISGLARISRSNLITGIHNNDKKQIDAAVLECYLLDEKLLEKTKTKEALVDDIFPIDKKIVFYDGIQQITGLLKKTLGYGNPYLNFRLAEQIKDVWNTPAVQNNNMQGKIRFLHQTLKKRSSSNKVSTTQVYLYLSTHSETPFLTQQEQEKILELYGKVREIMRSSEMQVPRAGFMLYKCVEFLIEISRSPEEGARYSSFLNFCIIDKSLSNEETIYKWRQVLSKVRILYQRRHPGQR